MNKGKVSCIMITRPGRLPLAQRAIIDFSKQTYDNKQLVIVVWDLETASAIDFFVDCFSYRELDISVVKVSFSSPLSQLFQAGVAASNGTWVVSWDDDNMNHPRRLERQLQLADSAEVSLMPSVFSAGMTFFLDSREIFFSTPCNKIKLTALLERRTFMFPRVAIDQKNQMLTFDQPGNPWLNFSERWIGTSMPYFELYDEHKWFIRGVHGDNLQSYDSIRAHVSNKVHAWDVDKLGAWREEIYKTLGSFCWDTDDHLDEIAVCGHDGIGFHHLPDPMHDYKRFVPGGGEVLSKVVPPADGTTRVEEDIDVG
jgi:hypothetical protein